MSCTIICIPLPSLHIHMLLGYKMKSNELGGKCKTGIKSFVGTPHGCGVGAIYINPLKPSGNFTYHQV
jgi:hypothetical protein